MLIIIWFSFGKVLDRAWGTGKNRGKVDSKDFLLAKGNGKGIKTSRCEGKDSRSRARTRRRGKIKGGRKVKVKGRG